MRKEIRILRNTNTTILASICLYDYMSFAI